MTFLGLRLTKPLLCYKLLNFLFCTNLISLKKPSQGTFSGPQRDLKIHQELAKYSLTSLKNSSFETPSCVGYCGTVTASDVAGTYRTIHHEVSITFNDLSHEFRHFNICFTFGRASNSSTNLSQLPLIPSSSRVQPRNLCQIRFLKQPPLPVWGLLRNPLARESSQAMFKEENSCYSNQFSTCTELALSFLLIFSGFISSRREAARQVKAALGSAGQRSACKALGGVLTHQVVLACSLHLLEDVLCKGCHRCHFVTEPLKPQRNRLFASPSCPWLAAEPYCYLAREQTCHWSVGSLAHPLQPHWDRFQPASGKRNWIQSLFCDSTFLQVFLGLKATTVITENTQKVLNCAKLHLFQYAYCGQALD